LNVCVLLVPVYGYSQEYTLDKCENLAIENNFTVKNERLNIKAASETQKEAFTRYFPVVKGEGAYYNANKGLAASEVAVPGVLPAPIPFSLMKNGTVAGVTATQPLFVGGRIFYGNKLASIGKDVANMKLELTKNDVVLKTHIYFWQIVNLKEKLKTISAVEKMLDNLYKDVNAFVKAGVANRNDLIRVELKKQEVQSNRLKIENGMQVSKMLLAQFIGVKSDVFDIEYGEVSEYKVPDSFYVNPGDAVNKRFESKILTKKVDAAKLKTKMSGGERLPSVAVGGGYLYHDLLEKSTSAGVVFATVSVPVSKWWGGSHKRKFNKIREQQAENEKHDAVELMTVEINQTWNELVEAYKQISLAKKSIESSTENLRIVNDFYKAGVVELTEVLDAQLLFRKSKNMYNDAYNEYQIKLVKYKQITNFN
jgi:outer membrane protein TolC